MGLFPSANDFRKAGPGVEKDTPRKTGIGRFFELVGRDMSGMFLANLLTCIGFLPVICLVYVGFLMNNLTVMVVSAIAGGILAGPALAGMYDTVLRALRDEAGYWWTTYRRAFKRNFKAAILPGINMLMYAIVLIVVIRFRPSGILGWYMNSKVKTFIDEKILKKPSLDVLEEYELMADKGGK